MVQIKLPVAFILVAAAVAHVVALPVPEPPKLPDSRAKVYMLRGQPPSTKATTGNGGRRLLLPIGSVLI